MIRRHDASYACNAERSVVVKTRSLRVVNLYAEVELTIVRAASAISRLICLSIPAIEVAGVIPFIPTAAPVLRIRSAVPSRSQIEVATYDRAQGIRRNNVEAQVLTLEMRQAEVVRTYVYCKTAT